jgi:RNA polymerase sigma-70 factor (ECF subfamily)
VISLNRAIAVGMSNGPLAGLAALDAVAEDDRLVGHYLVPAARGDLLARAGLLVEAVQALELAARRAPHTAGAAAADTPRRGASLPWVYLVT